MIAADRSSLINVADRLERLPQREVDEWVLDAALLDPEWFDAFAATIAAERDGSLGFFDKVFGGITKALGKVGKGISRALGPAAPIATVASSFIPGVGPLVSGGLTAAQAAGSALQAQEQAAGQALYSQGTTLVPGPNGIPIAVPASVASGGRFPGGQGVPGSGFNFGNFLNNAANIAGQFVNGASAFAPSGGSQPTGFYAGVPQSFGVPVSQTATAAALQRQRDATTRAQRNNQTLQAKLRAANAQTDEARNAASQVFQLPTRSALSSSPYTVPLLIAGGVLLLVLVTGRGKR
ncbi:MAG: hypothetical protein AAFP26_01085 [Planctomycetota bacterium]